MQQYIINKVTDPYDPDMAWCVEDTLDPPQVAPIYEEFTEADARIVCAILNSGIGPDWDSIEEDERWIRRKETRGLGGIE